MLFYGVLDPEIAYPVYREALAPSMWTNTKSMNSRKESGCQNGR